MYEPSSRSANKLYCAKKYQNRHFLLQAGICIHLMRKNVLYKYLVDTNVDFALLLPQIRKTL